MTGFPRYRDDFLEGVAELGLPLCAKVVADYQTAEDKAMDLVYLAAGWLDMVSERRLLRFSRPVPILNELIDALKHQYRHKGLKRLKRPRGSISPPPSMCIPLDDMEIRCDSDIDARALMIALRQSCVEFKEEVVLTKLAEGYSNREIAVFLGQHETTVGRYVERLRRRLYSEVME